MMALWLKLCSVSPWHQKLFYFWCWYFKWLRNSARKAKKKPTNFTQKSVWHQAKAFNVKHFAWHHHSSEVCVWSCRWVGPLSISFENISSLCFNTLIGTNPYLAISSIHFAYVHIPRINIAHCQIFLLEFYEVWCCYYVMGSHKKHIVSVKKKKTCIFREYFANYLGIIYC